MNVEVPINKSAEIRLGKQIKRRNRSMNATRNGVRIIQRKHIISRIKKRLRGVKIHCHEVASFKKQRRETTLNKPSLIYIATLGL